MANVDIRRNQWRTTVMLVAPVVLLAALVTHPYLSGRLPNDAGGGRGGGGRFNSLGEPYISPPPWRPG